MQPVTIYSTRSCPYCVSVKEFFKSLNVPFTEIGLDDKPDLRMKLSEENKGWRTVPMVFVGKTFVGGFTDTKALHDKGELLKLLQAEG